MENSETQPEAARIRELQEILRDLEATACEVQREIRAKCDAVGFSEPIFVYLTMRNAMGLIVQRQSALTKLASLGHRPSVMEVQRIGSDAEWFIRDSLIRLIGLDLTEELLHDKEKLSAMVQEGANAIGGLEQKPSSTTH